MNRRPRGVVPIVQQKTLPGERLWELCRRNLRAVQLPQQQVLWGLMKGW